MVSSFEMDCFECCNCDHSTGCSDMDVDIFVRIFLLFFHAVCITRETGPSTFQVCMNEIFDIFEIYWSYRCCRPGIYPGFFLRVST